MTEHLGQSEYRIEAPFSDAQNAAIEGWQSDDTVHPMTCGYESSHQPLVARESGLYCVDGDCDYWQSWAPRPVVDWRP